MSILNFSEGYRQYFEVVPAVTESLRRDAYRLRHDVYCRDLGFEPCRENGLESDGYDRHSLHCLVRALGTGSIVGGARLVLTDPTAPATPLPFESACGTQINRSVIDPQRLDRSRIAEISRLAVLGRYRRRKGEEHRPFAIETSVSSGTEIRLPYLPVALYLGLLAMARRSGIIYLFALSEPRLTCSINRLGGNLIPIGDEVNHRGQRIPSFMEVGTTIEGMNPYVREFFELIAEEVDAFVADDTSDDHLTALQLRA